MTDRPANGIPDGAVAQLRAAALKERVYIAFTSLAVVIALRAHGDAVSTAAACVTLLVTVGGAVLAVFLADLLAHVTVHADLPSRRRLRHMVTGSFGALVVAVPPLICLALAAIGVWTTATALICAMLVHLVGLAAIGYMAVRRLHLPVRQKLLVLTAEALLGLAVIALGLWAHA
ncbi:hypothetical protein [Streptomyces sp. NPDC004629]|uniref:hypothetical protein n=1 Tax=Streptomyces sp. NPDC004629 TaxID=3364705 RepID=UPI00369F24BD